MVGGMDVEKIRWPPVTETEETERVPKDGETQGIDWHLALSQ